VLVDRAWAPNGGRAGAGGGRWRVGAGGKRQEGAGAGFLYAGHNRPWVCCCERERSTARLAPREPSSARAYA
jgi:hypothetical protein